LDEVFSAYKDNSISNRNVNSHAFHRRLLRLSSALQKNIQSFDEIPTASSLTPIFGTNELSFAFMNISKFSNPSDSYPSDYELINKSVEMSTSSLNFLAEEISLLKPDLIITMNVEDYFETLERYL